MRLRLLIEVGHEISLMIYDDPTPPYRIMLSSFGMVRKSV